MSKRSSDIYITDKLNRATYNNEAVIEGIYHDKIYACWADGNVELLWEKIRGEELVETSGDIVTVANTDSGRTYALVRYRDYVGTTLVMRYGIALFENDSFVIVYHISSATSTICTMYATNKAIVVGIFNATGGTYSSNMWNYARFSKWIVCKIDPDNLHELDVVDLDDIESGDEIFDNYTERIRLSPLLAGDKNGNTGYITMSGLYSYDTFDDGGTLVARWRLHDYKTKEVIRDGSKEGAYPPYDMNYGGYRRIYADFTRNHESETDALPAMRLYYNNSYGETKFVEDGYGEYFEQETQGDLVDRYVRLATPPTRNNTNQEVQTICVYDGQPYYFFAWAQSQNDGTTTRNKSFGKNIIAKGFPFSEQKLVRRDSNQTTAYSPVVGGLYIDNKFVFAIASINSGLPKLYMGIEGEKSDKWKNFDQVQSDIWSQVVTSNTIGTLGGAFMMSDGDVCFVMSTSTSGNYEATKRIYSIKHETIRSVKFYIVKEK